MQKILLITPPLSGLLAVTLGAFGVHTLKAHINIESLSIWEKGIQYQFYHTLALLFCALYLQQKNSVPVRNAAICFIIGITCFSGSLYLLATRELTSISASFIGPVTPIGGLFFLIGWLILLIHFVTSPRSR